MIRIKIEIGIGTETATEIVIETGTVRRIATGRREADPDLETETGDDAGEIKIISKIESNLTFFLFQITRQGQVEVQVAIT